MSGTVTTISADLLQLASIFNTSKGNAEDFLAANIAPTRTALMRIAVCMGSNAKLILRVMDSNGANAQNVEMKDGVPIAAGAGQTFVWPMRTDRRYNFRHDVAGAVTIRDFVVDEVRGGVV